MSAAVTASSHDPRLDGARISRDKWKMHAGVAEQFAHRHGPGSPAMTSVIYPIGQTELFAQIRHGK
jgi:hypothetical protein